MESIFGNSNSEEIISKKIRHIANIEFKPLFIERYSKLTDWEKFREYSLRYLRRSIRVNTLKIGIRELYERLTKDWVLQPIPWCKEGFWIEHRHSERRDIGNLVEHVLGYIYLQEAVSMIPPLVLNPKPGEVILDLCAAPGSKSTQIAALIKNKGILVVNDINRLRLKPLTLNLQRVGATCSIITMMQGQFLKQKNQYDRVLIDAPCSGTGTIRKSLKTIKIWNPGMVKRLSKQQKQLIAVGFEALKPGGVLVYSTCTLEPEENEEVVDFLLNKYPNAKVEPVELNIKRSPAVLEFEGKSYNKEISKALRLWPQDNDTEGFFVCRIRKTIS